MPGGRTSAWRAEDLVTLIYYIHCLYQHLRTMAAVEAVEGKHALDRESPVARKKFKTSDLPLTQLQRSSIDGLLHTFKKKGEFDFLRKRVYAQFDEGVGLHSPT